MCVEHKISCKCKTHSISLNYKDEILPHEVIMSLYCPLCSSDIAFRPESMIADNGWFIEYDMEVAAFYKDRLPRDVSEDLSPDKIFDRGYCTWQGVYPGDYEDSNKEKTELTAMARTNPSKYISEMRDWANNRMKRLQKEGWRKADERSA